MARPNTAVPVCLHILTAFITFAINDSLAAEHDLDNRIRKLRMGTFD